jgi:cobalt-zinc-cadmium efflux system outer membrane protein
MHNPKLSFNRFFCDNGPMIRSFLITLLTTTATIAYASEVLELTTALERAETNSPKINLAAAEFGMKSGAVEQSYLYPNPSFIVDAEDFGGSKNYRAFKQGQITYSITQEIELWGKRAARQAFAAYERSASHWSYTLALRALRANVKHSFIDAAVLQEKLAVAQEKLETAEEVVQLTHAKVELGKIAPIGLRREEGNVARARLSLNRLRSHLANAYHELASYWGDDRPDFSAVTFPLFEIALPENLCELLERLNDHPELARWNNEIAAARQALLVEQVQPLPDVGVTGGFRQYTGNGAYGFVAAVEIPLPVWNQNQGNISRARHQISAAISHYEATLRDLQRQLQTAHRELAALYHEVEMLRGVVLATSEETLTLAKEGYQQGKYDAFELLEAKRTFFDLREQYLNSLQLYHQKRVDISQLLAD